MKNKIQICMGNPRQIIISMNNNIWTKKLEFFFVKKGKYQFLTSHGHYL